MHFNTMCVRGTQHFHYRQSAHLHLSFFQLTREITYCFKLIGYRGANYHGVRVCARVHQCKTATKQRENQLVSAKTTTTTTSNFSSCDLEVMNAISTRLLALCSFIRKRIITFFLSMRLLNLVASFTFIRLENWHTQKMRKIIWEYEY